MGQKTRFSRHPKIQETIANAVLNDNVIKMYKELIVTLSNNSIPTISVKDGRAQFTNSNAEQINEIQGLIKQRINDIEHFYLK